MLTQGGAGRPSPDRSVLSGAVRQLEGNVPLITSLLYVHAALLRMSVTAHAGGGSGGGSSRGGGAFAIALMSIKGQGVLLAFVYDMVGQTSNPETLKMLAFVDDTVGQILNPETCRWRRTDGQALWHG